MIDLFYNLMSWLDGLVGWIIWLIGAAIVVVCVGVAALWRRLVTGKRGAP